MKEHEINKLNNFISGWVGKNNDICDKIINAFNLFDGKHPGFIGIEDVNTKFKDSTDARLHEISLDLWKEYMAVYLQPIVNEYIKKYPSCNAFAPWAPVESVNVQHYVPGQAFHGWHTERQSNKVALRHLVFMTYLNDLDDGGETEFLHQNIKIKPQKGLTLIWPTDWTFTHRGLPSESQEKYIVTGWFNYVD